MARLATTDTTGDVEDSIVAAWNTALAVATSLQALKMAAVRALLDHLIVRDQVSGSPADRDGSADQLEAKRYGGPRSRWPGFWRRSPKPLDEFDDDPTGEALAIAEDALVNLPFYPRVVVVLRDFDGWRAEDVAQLLGVDLRVQRALLKRGREQMVRVLDDRARATRD